MFFFVVLGFITLTSHIYLRYSTELLTLVDRLLSVNPEHRPDIRDGIFRIPFIETHMKQMCRTGGSLGKIRNGTTDRKSSPAPKIDDSLCLLRSSSSWVQQSAKLKKKKEDETKERDRVSSEDTVLTEICQDDDTDLERLKNSTVNQSSSDAEYAASPAAASRIQTTPRFKDKKLSRIRRSTHRRRNVFS